MEALTHPFLHGLRYTPEGHEKDLADLKDWMSTQPHLPSISDEFCYLFLHSNYWKRKETKDTIENYFTLRTNTPDLFTGRDPLSAKNQAILDITHMVSMPHKTDEGYNILIYRLSDYDYSKLCFADAVRVFCMFNDIRLSEDGLSEGYIVIFDMKGCSLAHLTKVTLPALRAFMVYIQSAHPARLKKIHIVNTASFINQVMCLIKPLINSELMALLNLTTGGPSSVVDAQLLPEEYGGRLKGLQEYHNEHRQLMEKKYQEWLIDSEKFKVEEKMRIRKPNKGIFASLTGSFKALDID